MPNTENESEEQPQESTEAVEQPAPVAAAPDYAAEIAALRQDQANTLNMIREGFTMLASSQQQPTAPVIQDVTDEEIEQQLAEGKGAQAIRRMVAAQTARATAALKRDAVDPLATLVQTHGIDAIAALARQAAEASVDEAAKPYVARYRQEIDQAINGMAPELRLKPDNIKHAQAIILGHHLKEIVAEERERVIRQLRENPGSVPGAAVGREAKSTGPAVPTAEDLFGKNSKEAQMIRQAGGEDAWIQKHATSKYSSKTWGEYVQKHQAMHGQTPEGNA